MALSNTTRTLKKWRGQGYQCWITEYWNGFCGRRVDVWGFGDILACKPGEIALLQTTSYSGLSSHKRKIEDEDHREAAINWLQAGGKLYLEGWHKKPLKRGGKALRWKDRVYQAVLVDAGNGLEIGWEDV